MKFEVAGWILGRAFWLMVPDCSVQLKQQIKLKENCTVNEINRGKTKSLAFLAGEEFNKNLHPFFLIRNFTD